MTGFPPLGGGAGHPSAIVFMPGAASAGNVYETDAEIAAALDAVSGAAIVYVDASLAEADLTVVWNFQGRGAVCGTSASYDLFIKEGGQIMHPGLPFRNIGLQCSPTATRSIDFPPSVWDASPTLSFIDSTLALNTGATIPPIEVPAGTFLELLTSSATAFSTFFAPGVGLVAMESGGGGAGGTVFALITTDLDGNISAESFVGDATTTLYYFGDASVFPMPTWTLLTGGANAVFLDAADGVGYAPAVPGNGAGLAPTTVADALDRIAANVTNLHPIP
jgi:hypothetical protein